MSESAPSTSDAGPAVGVIETDAFCEACGYNLRTQKVWRDPQLNIAVCRCPDCGAHHAAGKSTTASSAWLKRLATLGLLVWIGLGLSFVGGTAFMLFMTQILAAASLTYSELETVDGRGVNGVGLVNGVQTFQLASQSNFGVIAPNPPAQDPSSPQPKPETFTTDQIVFHTRLADWLTGREVFDWTGSQYNGRYRSTANPIETLLFAAIILIPHVFAGVVMACASWFWPKSRRWVWAVLPVSTGLLAWLIFRTNGTRSYYSIFSRTEGAELGAYVIFTVAALQTLVIILGLLVGRALGRGLVQTFVPPGARPLLAFLWHADGKIMPSTQPKVVA